MSKKNPETNPESFIQNLRHVALTNTEAQEMRERLVAYSDLHAVPESFSPKISRARVSVFSASFFSSYRVLVAGALIVLILVSGTGVSYAAEGTLPGQILYPVKVSIIEPIQGALITTTVGQAEWQNELTERRLTEASTLAAQNNLGTSTQEYLEQAVAEHVALSQDDATKLADAGNETVALSVRSDLEARLSAHADFFTLITPRLAAGGDATTTSAVIALLQGIEADRTQVEMSREATEAALASTTVVALANDTSATSSGVYGPRMAYKLALEAGGNNASSTPAQLKILAYVQAQNSDRQTEESTLLRKSSALFRLLPGMTVSSSTASTTFWITTASSTMATTSPFRELLHQEQSQQEASSSDGGSVSETISIPSE